MKFIRALFERQKSDVTSAIELAHTRGFTQDVVGEASYQKALTKITGGKRDRSAKHYCAALLICETGNRYDKNAVAVKIDNRLVGYLPKDVALGYRSELAQLASSLPNAVVRAKIVGGWKQHDSEGHFGVKLNLKRPLVFKSE
ncbi:hypothetical protein [Yoonia maritima]|uniref:hypothetical protein n=1 Tax=Yoonia maritima TaxID=1435347 RepID=UPI0037367F5B